MVGARPRATYEHGVQGIDRHLIKKGTKRSKDMLPSFLAGRKCNMTCLSLISLALFGAVQMVAVLL